MTGLVFSIEEFSTFNGPGIRATVFLKGCPLACRWCHSPEGQSFANEILRSPNGCAGCGNCRRAARREGRKLIYTEESIRSCPNNLLRCSAQELTPEELLLQLGKNIPLLNASGGGVTFSGGEPLAQPEFLCRTLELLEGQTHRAVQCALFAPEDVFRRVLERTDYVLCDLKLMDDALHRRWTGRSNRSILRNFDVLCQSGKPFTVRTPLIPGVTDTPENLDAIAAHLQSRGIGSIELLPYNKMAGSKYALAGRIYDPGFDERVPPQPRQELFQARGIRVSIL